MYVRCHLQNKYADIKVRRESANQKVVEVDALLRTTLSRGLLCVCVPFAVLVTRSGAQGGVMPLNGIKSFCELGTDCCSTQIDWLDFRSEGLSRGLNGILTTGR